MNGGAGPDGMEAGWIDSPQGKLFACFHPPQGGLRRDCAVLLCDPFGADRMNLHASYRALALRLAQAGFAALRVDYPGTCDSSGYPRAPALLDTWLASLHTACEFLLRESGASQLSLFGALLGGTLATVVAAARRDVTGLVLWGALPNGRTFLREAAALQAFMGSNRAGRVPRSYQRGDQESNGYLISRDFAEAVARLDLSGLDGPALRAAAVFRRGRAAPPDGLARKLRAAGAAVYEQRSPVVEIAELIDQRSVPPAALLAEMLEWWSATYREQAPRPAPQAPRARLAHSVVLDAPDGTRVREEVVRFGPDRALIGIVSEPVSEHRANLPAVVFVNGGAKHRPGINRNSAEWARSWAARGRIALRMDVRGVGDSPPLRPEDLCALHRAESRLDIRAGFDLLAERYRSPGFVCVGLCAGAYQALHTALEDRRVVGLVLLNPLRFQGPRPSFPGYREVDAAPLAQRARSALDPRKWVGALRGQHDVHHARRMVMSQLRSDARAQLERALARLRGEPLPPPSWIAGAFRELTARPCNVLLVFNADEAIIAVVNRELGADRARLLGTGRFAVELVDETDHIFSPLWSQERVAELLEAAIGRWLEASAPAPHGARAQEGP